MGGYRDLSRDTTGFAVRNAGPGWGGPFCTDPHAPQAHPRNVAALFSNTPAAGTCLEDRVENTAGGPMLSRLNGDPRAQVSANHHRSRCDAVGQSGPGLGP